MKKYSMILFSNFKSTDKHYIPLSAVLFFYLFVILIQSCKENPTAPEQNVSITIQPQIFYGYVGQKILFTVEIQKNDNSDSMKINWYSMDETIVIMDSEGNAEIKDSGTVSIIAELALENGKILAKDTAVVIAEQLFLRIFPRELHLSTENIYQLSINPIIFNVYWSSGNINVATVDEIGVIRLKDLGIAFISATVKDSTGNVLAKDSIPVFVEWKILLSMMYPISSMSYNPVTKSIMIGTRNGQGIFFSNDNGLTWEQRNSGLNLNSIAHIDIITRSRTNYEVMLAKVNTIGIVKTEDEGLSWQSVNTPGGYITSLVIHPYDKNTAYAINREGNFHIFKTSNLGTDWQLISSIQDPSGTSPELFIDPITPEKLYIGAHKSFRSSDSGINWEEIIISNTGPDFIIVHLDEWGKVYFQDYNWDGATNLRLIRSIDNGYSGNILVEYNSGSYVYTTDSEMGNTIILCSPEKFYLSSDYGMTWENKQINFLQMIFGESIGIFINNLEPLEFFYAVNRGSEGFLWIFRKGIL